MTRHKHYDVIVAYAEGKQIQWRDLYSDVWVDVSRPVFLENLQYRIKPEVTTLYSRQFLYFSELNSSVRLVLLQATSLEALENECKTVEKSDKYFLKWVGNIEKVEYVKPTSN